MAGGRRTGQCGLRSFDRHGLSPWLGFGIKADWPSSRPTTRGLRNAGDIPSTRHGSMNDPRAND